MNELQSKLREVFASLLPIVIYVVFCTLVFVPAEPRVVWRFLLGSVFLFAGLSFFLWGVDQSMVPIGHYMALRLVQGKTRWGALLFSFFIGFIVTVAEPDLLILGQQIEEATGGLMDARFFVLIVSAGVGLMIALGSNHLLSGKRLTYFFLVTYVIIGGVAFFSSNEFIAIAFDASGATTGSLTTPFILAMSYAFSRIKKTKDGTDNSFGLVGAMSSGPIFATLLLSLRMGSSLAGGKPTPMLEEGVAVLFRSLVSVMGESLMALAPITLLFFIINARHFKIDRREMIGIIRGLIYAVLGLTFFLAGANGGFMEMGRLLGQGLTQLPALLILLLAFFLGYIVVAAEPAVHVLGEQVEEVTGGRLAAGLLGKTLSIGVGCAVTLSVLRILIPGLQIWHLLLPGFALALLLSFYVDDIFVGIAFDAGGVASGPMAATFVLAFSQGVAEAWPLADILRDGFGIIAMIAMTPIVSILTLGALTKRAHRRRENREARQPQAEGEEILVPVDTSLDPMPHYDFIMIPVPAGLSDQVIEEAEKLGVGGATVVHGRDERGRQWQKYSLDLNPEKEAVCFLMEGDRTEAFVDGLSALRLAGNPLPVFTLPTLGAAGIAAGERKEGR